MVDVELSERELNLIHILLIRKINEGTTVDDAKESIALLDKIHEIIIEENSVNE
jgi:hypothetical protein